MASIGPPPGGSGRGAPTDSNYLIGTADDDLSGEIVVGTAPAGELGGTWGSPTVDTVHAEGGHAAMIATHTADSDAHHAEAHAAAHSDGGGDEVTVENLATAGAVGTVLTSDGDGSVSMQAPAVGVLSAAKTSDTTRNNTATVTADPDLQLEVEANHTYFVSLLLRLTQADGAADFDVQLTLPSIIGNGGALASLIVQDGGTLTTVVLDGAETLIQYGAGDRELFLSGYVVIGGTGGTMSIDWAQNIQTVADNTMEAGSAISAIDCGANA